MGTFEQDRERLTNLDVICTTCGKKMRNLGEWPIQHPRSNDPKDMFQAARYMCTTCRQPHPEVAKGIPMGIAIII